MFSPRASPRLTHISSPAPLPTQSCHCGRIVGLCFRPPPFSKRPALETSSPLAAASMSSSHPPRALTLTPGACNDEVAASVRHLQAPAWPGSAPPGAALRLCETRALGGDFGCGKPGDVGSAPLPPRGREPPPSASLSGDETRRPSACWGFFRGW